MTKIVIPNVLNLIGDLVILLFVGFLWLSVNLFLMSMGFLIFQIGISWKLILLLIIWLLSLILMYCIGNAFKEIYQEVKSDLIITSDV